MLYRFNRLRWGYTEDAARPHGILAAGMENGELALWDPAKIIAAGSSADSDSLILRNTTHTGPIRGLSFNPIQKSLLASGATAGEVYIWDLKDPSKPYTPTTESAAAAGPGAAAGGAKKLEDITSIEWNRQVPYILAGASSTGYCVVWDLRGKREVVTQYPVLEAPAGIYSTRLSHSIFVSPGPAAATDFIVGVYGFEGS